MTTTEVAAMIVLLLENADFDVELLPDVETVDVARRFQDGELTIEQAHRLAVRTSRYIGATARNGTPFSITISYTE